MVDLSSLSNAFVFSKETPSVCQVKFVVLLKPLVGLLYCRSFYKPHAMSNLIRNDSEYFEAFKTCFKNKLKHVFNDLFLEKSEDLEMKCASLLLKQVRYQYHLLRQIPHHGDFQTLLDEFNMDVGCLKYILSNEVTNHDLRMTETQMSLHITCDMTKTPFKPIKCQSLVNFTDKFLQLIIAKLQNHQEVVR